MLLKTYSGSVFRCLDALLLQVMSEVLTAGEFWSNIYSDAEDSFSASRKVTDLVENQM